MEKEIIKGVGGLSKGSSCRSPEGMSIESRSGGMSPINRKEHFSLQRQKIENGETFWGEAKFQDVSFEAQ